jgi:lysophospholipase L1-like esterase
VVNLRFARAIGLAVALAVLAGIVVACSSSPPVRPPQLLSYYLALGDSLSQGVQPDATGISVETSQGYPDQLFAVLHRTRPGLRLVHLGCPGETTKTMINGGICQYSGGSQLAAATAFLRAHRGRVFLVTLDIGANDPEDCDQASGLGKVPACVAAMPQAGANLATTLSRLRAAAGPGVRIVGMNYYLPYLSLWRNGLFGEAVARLSEGLVVSYNALLTKVYTHAGIRVANVFGAFDTSDFGNQMTVPGIGTVPRNVAMICEWTWQCTAAPRGPNQHANATGYGVIARAFLHAANLS